MAALKIPRVLFTLNFIMADTPVWHGSCIGRLKTARSASLSLICFLLLCFPAWQRLNFHFQLFFMVRFEAGWNARAPKKEKYYPFFFKKCLLKLGCLWKILATEFYGFYCSRKLNIPGFQCKKRYVVFFFFWKSYVCLKFLNIFEKKLWREKIFMK